MIKGLLAGCFVLALFAGCHPRASKGLHNRDLHRDIEVITTKGTLVIRLSDSTPLHRDNFLRLVKSHYYDGVLFHRVIKNFMIQAGDPNSRTASDTTELGGGDTTYTIPAEFRASLFHHKGVLAAAREGDNVNPKRESSGTQFYIVQGRRFTDAGLDSLEQGRLKGRKIPPAHREVYKTEGGCAASGSAIYRFWRSGQGSGCGRQHSRSIYYGASFRQAAGSG